MKAFIILALVGVVTAFSLRNQLKDDNKDARLKRSCTDVLTADYCEIMWLGGSCDSESIRNNVCCETCKKTEKTDENILDEIFIKNEIIGNNMIG